MGYHRAGFEIMGVDVRPQPDYPFNLVCMDAIQFCADHGHEYDAIHASPPCQAYTGMRNLAGARQCDLPEYPDLIDATREALQAVGRLWIIENVQRSPLRTQFILCGASFGLTHLARHRHFESSHLFPAPPKCRHYQEAYTVAVYGSRPDGRRVSYRNHRLCRVASSVCEAQALMGISWTADWRALCEAIPPAYTEWIGRWMIKFLEIGDSHDA